MKPHNLLLNYGLYKKMEIYRPAPASFEEMAKFHSEDYLTFLRPSSLFSFSFRSIFFSLSPHGIEKRQPSFS